jgi:hypothetical protein
MTTTFAHRVTILIPAARQAAINTWWQANLDSLGGASTFTVGLSADGNAPATHYWMSGAFTDTELRAMIARLCTLASISAPALATWNGWTRQQKLDWLSTNLPTILANTGIRVVRDDGDGAWSDPDAALAAHGVQRVVSP